MTELAQLVTNYGISIIIVVIFLLQSIEDRKKYNTTIDQINNFTQQNHDLLGEMKKSNENISKSLDLLHQAMNNQESCLKEHDRRSERIEQMLR